MDLDAMDLDGSATLPESSWTSDIWESNWAAIVLGIVALSITTRLFSGFLSPPQTTDENGVKTVPTIPYWLPIIGHFPNLVFAPDSLMNWARTKYKGGAFALNLGGTTHNFVFHPSLGTALVNNRGAADPHKVFRGIMCSVFGMPRSEKGKYDIALSDISGCYKYLLSEPSLGIMVQNTVDTLKRNISSLVTFSESMVDQTQWERNTSVWTIDVRGERVAEANFFPLIRDFVTFTASPSLIGTDFMNNNPTIFNDLWAMDKGFLYLATGLPRWIPCPPLTSAHIARYHVLNALQAFEEALEKEHKGQDPGEEWQNLDDISDLLKARTEVYRKHGFTMKARAAFELSLLWAMNANSNPLIFWMLNHIYADKQLLAKLRDEVEPYVRPLQPSKEFNLPEPPRLEYVDQEGLLANCPLLKSCYIETLRLDTSVTSIRRMEEDLVLAGRDKTAEKFLLKKGTYAHVANDVHHKDPAYFEDPNTWRADRHVVKVKDREGQDWVSVDMGTIRPFGGGSSMCKGRAFAQKEILVFVASIFSLWDIEAAGGGPWKMPRHDKGTGTYSTADSTKVWIRQRDLTPKKGAAVA